MRARHLIAGAAVMALCVTGWAATVTLTLSSPQAGTSVAGGATVDWTITASVTTGDNQGLALISTDLVQGDNPAKFDFPPASGVPTAMANFSRPYGISNPGETDPATGYIGVQRGTAGEMNLIQIGGGQNTFGQAMPAGTGIGESATVVTGVGHTPVVIAQGSFAVPSVDGDYTFTLANPIANLLDTQTTFWTVIPVDTWDLTGAGFTVTVGGPPLCAGDTNCDGIVDYDDIDPFVAALSCVGGDPSCWDPACPWLNADCNLDGNVTYADIDPFVARIGQTCP